MRFHRVNGALNFETKVDIEKMDAMKLVDIRCVCICM